MDVAKLDLWFRRGISVITLVFGIVQLYLTEKNILIDAGFIIYGGYRWLLYKLSCNCVCYSNQTGKSINKLSF